ncbi:hypothetical protein Lal_00016155 [Lupinus albus]|uniref:Putative tetrahydroberberine oxidase n=1 Tax=Lupinus albus TaxID=3870 RepID=A0A6A5MFZ8_LUPAL|nr:putative tetrahydroberberine oxidase [Lupinus albus]KAF1873036.1 hypothetical protein Lal_00016155 [Lupinus albus]
METFSFRLSIITIMLSILQAASDSPNEKFLNCLYQSKTPNPISNVVYTQRNQSFLSILNMHIQNKRFKAATTAKPLAIVTAQTESHVQTTILCAKTHGIQIRIRSGGHDTDGLSYVSDVPYVVLDLFPQHSVDVDISSATAWVQAGATLGELYYHIYEKSKVHAFPAGVCTSLGTGGHFSGGGYGNLLRKYGLSVDNIIDAKIVDANGKILDRKSMGEDLFWAIRGGGGASFGVILSWKIKLVPVPANVTVFTVNKIMEDGAADVLYKWQEVAPNLDEDLFIRVAHSVVDGTKGGNKTVQVAFIGEFLGAIDRLLPLVSKSFPELGLKKSDCIEMPWINSTLYWNGVPKGTPLESLLTIPKESSPVYFKIKSDYVKKPIPKKALYVIWDKFIESKTMIMQWNPYGGKMAQIPSSATPFPHRAGNLFKIQYFLLWTEDGDKADNQYLNISRSFYNLMTPYASMSPRETFLNYRDIDIGANHPSNITSMDKATIYGSKFFKDNFDRLVQVKTTVDPLNFFKYEQSIPPKSG